MKKMICALIFMVSTAASAATYTVIMKSLSYEPKVLNLIVGDSVQWENKSYTEHSASFVEFPIYETGLIQSKKSSKPLQFTQAGTFHYHCSVHGKTMSGTLVVAEKK